MAVITKDTFLHCLSKSVYLQEIEVKANYYLFQYTDGRFIVTPVKYFQTIEGLWYFCDLDHIFATSIRLDELDHLPKYLCAAVIPMKIIEQTKGQRPWFCVSNV